MRHSSNRQSTPPHPQGLVADPDPLLSNTEAAGYIRSSPNTLTNWRVSDRADRRIPYVKVGSRVFYRRSWLDRFLTENTVGAFVQPAPSKARREG
jgi:hypothetical protein